MAKAAYIRLNTHELRKTLEEMGFTFSGFGDVQNATNICITSHKTYSCISDYLIETQDPYILWSIYREDCGKDIKKFIEMCKDEIELCKKEMYKTSMVPAERFNK